jgi:predicted transcriptional regulator
MAPPRPKPSRSVFPGFADMAQSPEELIESLVERRRALGLSQTQVAAAMGTSQSAVARLERGDADVRLSTLDRYAAALGQQLGWARADVAPSARRRRS